MTKITLAIFIGMLVSHIACAQDITGSWRGVTQERNATQISLNVSRSRSGTLRASIIRGDSGQSLPVDRIEFQDSTLKFSVLLLDGAYEGRASADGNSIMGTWTQARRAHPMKLERVASETPKTAATPPPMTANADLEFEAATIKPSGPNGVGRSFAVNGRHFFTRNTTLTDLIQDAYGLQPRQILGIPSWAENAHYDVAAEFNGDEGMPSKEQFRQMLQKFLKDRFSLVTHHAQKEFTVYALVVGNREPKLTRSQDGPDNRHRAFLHAGPGGGRLLIEKNATMGDLVSFLMSQEPDWQVVDQTNLRGEFDFDLNLLPEASPANAADESAPEPSNPVFGPSVLRAVEEQLGLKLKSTKAPIEVIVIDHVGKPSAN